MADAKEDAPTAKKSTGGAEDAKTEENRKEEDILQHVMNFAMSDDFEAAFEDFAELHKASFLKVLVMDEGAEHPLAWHDIYLDYLHTFEGKIESFINRTGYEINDFYEECKNVLEGENVWGETRFFLEALLATAEYQSFVQLMKNEMERFRVELDIEEGAADDDDAAPPGSPSRGPAWGGAATPGSAGTTGTGTGTGKAAAAEPFQARISSSSGGVSTQASPKNSSPGPGPVHGPTPKPHEEFQRLDSKGNAIIDESDSRIPSASSADRLDSKGEPSEEKESK